MLIRIREEHLAEHGKGRPPEFLHDVRAVARLDGRELLITAEEWGAIVRKYLPKAKESTAACHPIEPTAAELAANFAGAMARWSSAGFPTVSAVEYSARAAICDRCEHWDGRARLGLGRCRAPGCGCTRFKRWLATERCPLGQWPAAADATPDAAGSGAIE